MAIKSSFFSSGLVVCNSARAIFDKLMLRLAGGQKLSIQLPKLAREAVSICGLSRRTQRGIWGILKESPEKGHYYCFLLQRRHQCVRGCAAHGKQCNAFLGNLAFSFGLDLPTANLSSVMLPSLSKDMGREGGSQPSRPSFCASRQELIRAQQT